MRDPDPAVPRKRFGQHFLVDEFVVDEIVALAALQAGDAVCEIGPGEGVLTAPLLATGAMLMAIEIDRDLAARLHHRFADVANFGLHCGDVLQFDWSTLAARAPRWQLVGNLPYNISTPLLLRLLEHATLFSRMIVMVQREVAVRLAAPAGNRDYGRLSVMVQRRCSVDLAFDVGPLSFRPPPKVDSSIVVLTPHARTFDGAVEARLESLVRQAFSARRKTIANALRGVCDARRLELAGIAPGLRPEQIEVAQYANLASLLTTGE